MRVAVPKHVCVYCGGFATTRDHVPPKFLLKRPPPSNLRRVPCCRRCNIDASLDEQYFLVLLGQISLSPAIQEMISTGGVIDRTLSRAPALEERLLRALEVDNESGHISIRPEIERVNRVLKKIATGLYALRYGSVPERHTLGPARAYPYDTRDERPTPYFVATFTERFRAKRWNMVQKGSFSYIFVRDPEDRRQVWCIMDILQTLWGVVHLPHPRYINGGGQVSSCYSNKRR